jgi:hypothetical protein
MHSYFCVGAGLGAPHSDSQVVRLIPVTDSLHLPLSHVYFGVVGLGGARPQVTPEILVLSVIAENMTHVPWLSSTLNAKHPLAVWAFMQYAQQISTVIPLAVLVPAIVPRYA